MTATVTGGNMRSLKATVFVHRKTTVCCKRDRVRPGMTVRNSATPFVGRIGYCLMRSFKMVRRPFYVSCCVAGRMRTLSWRCYFNKELALLWQIYWIDRQNRIPESDFQ